MSNAYPGNTPDGPDGTERTQTEEAIRKGHQLLASTYNTVSDAIFHLAVEPEGQFRFISVNAAFLKNTGMNPEMVIGKTVSEFIPDPPLTRVLGKYRQAIDGKTTVRWEETQDFPAGRLLGEVSLVPVFDNNGTCTHLVGSVRDITESKRVEAVLRENERQLQSLAGSLFASQEEERRRISRELHDDLTQRLASLAIELGIIAGESARRSEHLPTRLRTLQRAAVEAAEAIRHIAYQLHPGELDEFGLATALQVFCEDFSRRGITVEFTSRTLPELVNREVASCLYRITQESLRNVVKHANASQAWVTLEGRDNSILLQVRDSGVGFPLDSLRAGAGLGVLSMQERVRNLHGSFRIESRPDQGTVVTVEVPLLKGERSAAGSSG
jgi:PAS domain S-box-containing protein